MRGVDLYYILPYRLGVQVNSIVVRYNNIYLIITNKLYLLYRIKFFLLAVCSEAMVVVFLMFKTESMASHYVVATPSLHAR